MSRGKRLGDELINRVLSGGFPAALARASTRRRRDWQTQYVDALTQRDMRELARIRSLETVPKLLELAAGQTAPPFNASRPAGPFALTRPTTPAPVTLVSQLFLL